MAEQLRNQGIAQTLNVHRSTRGEVEQLFAQAGRAVCVDASPIDLALGANQRAIALRTVFRDVDFVGTARVLRVFDYADDLGDNVASALDLHEVAEANSQTLDLVGVVQRGARDRSAADLRGGQHGDRSDFAGAPHLKLYVFQPSNGGARRKFIRNSPARSPSRKAKPSLLRGRVHLEHNAVDLVAQTIAQRIGFGDKCENLVDGIHRNGVRIDVESSGAQCFERNGLRGQKRLAGLVEIGGIPPIQQSALDEWGTRFRRRIVISVQQKVGVEVQPSLGDDVRLQRTQSSRSGVARIGCGSLAVGLTLLVQLAEGGVRHHHLAAHLKAVGQSSASQLRRTDAERHGANGANVRGHILADRAVAARQSALQMRRAVRSGRVVQRQRQAVELQLADITHSLRSGQGFAYTLIPGAQIGLTVGVVQREHGPRVRRLHKAVARLAADPLRRRIRSNQLGMRRLQSAQTMEAPVVLGVAERGNVEDVIQMFVVAKILAQGFDLLRGSKFGGHPGMIIKSARSTRRTMGRAHDYSAPRRFKTYRNQTNQKGVVQR